MVLITHLAIRVVRLVSRSLSDRGSPDYIMWSPNHSSTSSSNSRISASVDPEPLMVFPGSGGEERGWCARDEQHGIVSTQFCIPRRSSCSSSASAFTSCCCNSLNCCCDDEARRSGCSSCCCSVGGKSDCRCCCVPCPCFRSSEVLRRLDRPQAATS